MTKETLDNMVKTTVNAGLIRWYEDKGYIVPKEEVQLWANKNGKRVKNGTKFRVKNGTKIMVKILDLPPNSNIKIPVVCPRCETTSYIKMNSYKNKQSDICVDCVKKKIKGDGSHGYWVNKLITNSEEAKCDISNESDKRFLVLHHLDSRNLGGRNIPDNYVVLSANYHMAFHMSCGGTNVPCTKEDYMNFKKKEQADMLSNDWQIIQGGN